MKPYRPLFFRNPRLIPAMLFSAGLGVAGYYGLQWRDLPHLSEQELEQSAELNLALDLARMAPEQRPQGQQLQEMKTRERSDVQADLDREREVVHERFAAGLVAMVFGIGQLVFVYLNERAKSAR